MRRCEIAAALGHADFVQWGCCMGSDQRAGTGMETRFQPEPGKPKSGQKGKEGNFAELEKAKLGSVQMGSALGTEVALGVARGGPFDCK